MTPIPENSCPGELRWIAVDAIDTSPRWWRAREHVDGTDMALLAASIRTSPAGVQEPVVVRETDIPGCYEVVQGLRRVLAARAAGLEQLPARALGIEESEAAIASLAGHTSFRDLPLLQKAWCALDILERTGMPQKQLAERLGVKQPTMTGYVKVGQALPRERTLALAEQLGVEAERVVRLGRRQLGGVLRAATEVERLARTEELLRSLLPASPTSPAAEKLHQVKWPRRLWELWLRLTTAVWSLGERLRAAARW